MLLTLAACGGVATDLPPGEDPPAESLPRLELDAGSAFDAGAALDGGSAFDAGEALDAGTPIDAGASSDAGLTDAGAPFDAGQMVADAGAPRDAGQPVADAGTRLVEVLLAQGRLGRTTVSCDEGRTWVLDRDEAAGSLCGDPPRVECFHHPWASMGLVHTGTSVVATWGWGAAGRVRRTVDGVTWQDVIVGTSFAGITAGAGAVMAASSRPEVSRTDGQLGSWVTGGDVRSNGTIARHTGFVPAGGGRFFIMLDDSLRSSDDQGTTWATVTLPAGCGSSARGLLTHDATIILVRWNGGLCTSTDRGQTWANRQVAMSFSSSGVYGNGAFFLWDGATRYRSIDGLTWTSAAGSPGDVSIGPVVVTSNGTFVAYKGGWQSEYANERIYRSADGLTWQTLPATAHAHSHPITHLVTGRLRASSVCP